MARHEIDISHTDKTAFQIINDLATQSVEGFGVFYSQREEREETKRNL